MIRKQGYAYNHKRVYWVYKQMGFNIRKKRKRIIPERVKEPLTLPINTNIMWSIDFMQDSFLNAKSFRTLNIIDDFNLECLWITADVSIASARVTRELDKLIEYRGKPLEIRVDNGPEFTSMRFQDWCERNDIKIRYIQPGKPVQNSFIERFNRSYREEILNAYLFSSFEQVNILTQEWIEYYNNKRPHEALGDLTPVDFSAKYGKASVSIFENIKDNEICVN